MNESLTNGKDKDRLPEITLHRFLCMQVCVPFEWTDEQVLEFANQENLCGTENGWFIRRQGDEALAGDDEQVSCGSRVGCVHIVLDA